jgi:hypothetical protein
MIRYERDFFLCLFPGFEVLRFERAGEAISESTTRRRTRLQRIGKPRTKSISPLAKSTHLLAPIPMASCHRKTHFAQISHLLSLEAVQVRLYGGACILEILCGKVQRVFKLSNTMMPSESRHRRASSGVKEQKQALHS